MTRRIIAIALLAVGATGALSGALSAQSSAPQPHLNRTADAILALKSAKFALTREGAPAFLDERNGVTFTNADCMYAAPDRVACNVKVSLRNGTIVQLTRVWVPEGTFQSNPLTRQFAKMPADTNFNGVALFARTGIPDVLRAGVQKAQVAGREQVQERDAVHLKGEVSGAKLNTLMGAVLKPEQMYPVDLWTEEATGIPLRLHVDEGGGNGWLIQLGGINDPVSIPTPQVPPAAARPPA
jgi:hypothetical protein